MLGKQYLMNPKADEAIPIFFNVVVTASKYSRLCRVGARAKHSMTIAF